MRPTPRTDVAAIGFGRLLVENTPDKFAMMELVAANFARTLERELAEAVELLRAIVVLDDGDKPDLWHYQDEFVAARAFLKRMEGK